MTKNFKVTLMVSGPDDLTKEDINRIVAAIIASGQDCAYDTPDDWDDEDAEIAAILRIKIKDYE